MTIEQAILKCFVDGLNDTWRGGSNHENDDVLGIGIDEQAELISEHIKPTLLNYSEFVTLLDKKKLTAADNNWIEDFEILAGEEYRLAEQRTIEIIKRAVTQANTTTLQNR